MRSSRATCPPSSSRSQVEEEEGAGGDPVKVERNVPARTSAQPRTVHVAHCERAGVGQRRSAGFGVRPVRRRVRRLGPAASCVGGRPACRNETQADADERPGVGAGAGESATACGVPRPLRSGIETSTPEVCPTIVMVCAPGAASAGIVTSTSTTPSASAVKEPSGTGAEKNVTTTVSPGVNPSPRIVIVPPGTTVVSLRRSPSGGQYGGPKRLAQVAPGLPRRRERTNAEDPGDAERRDG